LNLSKQSTLQPEKGGLCGGAEAPRLDYQRNACSNNSRPLWRTLVSWLSLLQPIETEARKSIAGFVGSRTLHKVNDLSLGEQHVNILTRSMGRLFFHAADAPDGPATFKVAHSIDCP